jgi:hypothetical protein
MNMPSINSAQSITGHAPAKSGRPQSQHPRPPQGDTVEISPEATQQLSANVPSSVTSAVSDLQGDQANMGDDLQTIADYFRAHGGSQARNAFMQAYFSKDQLDAFRQSRTASSSV